SCSVDLYRRRYEVFPYTTLFRSIFRTEVMLRFRERARTEKFDDIRFEEDFFCEQFFGENMEFVQMISEKLLCALVLFINHDTHLDRKSTRLNSSHVKISYAVFCL